MITKATHQLHNAGQSIWLDNITRALLNSGGRGRIGVSLSPARALGRTERTPGANRYCTPPNHGFSSF
jgi:hypothetical protein